MESTSIFTPLVLLLLLHFGHGSTDIGCFIYDQNYEFSFEKFQPDQKPITDCATRCGDLIDNYFAVTKVNVNGEEYVECQCSSKLPWTARSSGCTNECEGRPCGGNMAMSVYSVCNLGSYGWHENGLELSCTNQCHCKGNASCRVTNGECADGCAPGYYGKTCDRSCNCKPEGSTGECDASGKCICLSGRYGDECDKKCHCAGGAVCDAATGTCPGECAPGFYGKDCTAPCNCADGAPCMQWTGHCQGGCKAGYYGFSCDEPCSCPRNISRGTCHKVYGSCDCLDGQYGQNCEKACYCSGGAACDGLTGRCPGKCNARYYGYACDRHCQCKGGAACEDSIGLCPEQLVASSAQSMAYKTTPVLMLLSCIMVYF